MRPSIRSSGDQLVNARLPKSGSGKDSTPCYWSLVSCYRRKRAAAHRQQQKTPTGEWINSAEKPVGKLAGFKEDIATNGYSQKNRSVAKHVGISNNPLQHGDSKTDKQEFQGKRLKSSSNSAVGMNRPSGYTLKMARHGPNALRFQDLYNNKFS